MKDVKSPDDSELIKMALAGRTECFETLMRRHLVVVKRRVTSIVRNAAEAEDVLQDVQLKAWIHLSSFRCDSSFRTWITRIAINEALQSYRRARRGWQRDEFNLDTLTASGDSPFRSYARAELAHAVHKAIGRLPSNFRQILILRDLQELSVKEAAHHLKKNARLVTSRLFRARAMLSKTLQRQRLRVGHAMPEIKRSPAPDWRAEIAA